MRKYSINIIFLLIVCVFTASNGYGMSNDNSSMHDEKSIELEFYSHKETQAVAQLLVSILADTRERTGSKFHALPLNQQILIASWCMGGRRGRLTSANDLFSDNTINVLQNNKDAYGLLMDAIDYSLFWRRDSKKDPEKKRHEENKRDHYDQFADAVLEMVSEHIEKRTYSVAFLSDALNLSYWMWQSDENRQQSIKKIDELIQAARNDNLRRALNGSLFLMPNCNELVSIFKRLSSDNDTLIAQRSSWWLVTHGKKQYIAKYIRLSWVLYGKTAFRIDDRYMPIYRIDLQNLLGELVPASGNQITYDRQMEWLQKHLDDLKWDQSGRVYSAPNI